MGTPLLGFDEATVNVNVGFGPYTGCHRVIGIHDNVRRKGSRLGPRRLSTTSKRSDHRHCLVQLTTTFVLWL